MSEITLGQLPKISTISDDDRIVFVSGSGEYLISKSDFVKFINGLSPADRSKLSTILTDGAGSKVLTDNGEYMNILGLMSAEQFETNGNSLIEIKGYHTHTNPKVLEQITDSNGVMHYNGHYLKVDKTCTLSASRWSSQQPYSQTVAVEGITSDSSPIVDIVISENTETGIKEADAFACITKITTGNGTITALCYSDKPEVDINLKIGVI